MANTTTIEDQPAPKATNRTPAWELVQKYVLDHYEPDESANVLADMRDRDKLGRERYGVPLTADNGRKHLVDAYQEQLDGAVYLRAWLDEQHVDLNLPAKADSKHATVVLMFATTVEMLIRLRALL